MSDVRPTRTRNTEKLPSKLRDALEYLIAAQPENRQNITQVASILNVSPQYLYKCLQLGETSAYTAMSIEMATDGLFTRDELAPSVMSKAKVRIARAKRKADSEGQGE